MFSIFQIIILIFSAVIHEVSHGLMAEKLGDNTARLAGRLTLNPLKHLDFFGSFILPVSLYFLSGGSFVFGWAKPVPYNPLNLKNPLRDGGLIALFGPLSNFFIALFFGLILRFGENYFLGSQLAILFSVIIYINILLGVFNLVPIPPLDGSKVLFGFLPNKNWSFKIINFFEQYGFVLLLIFLFFGFKLIIPIINLLFKLITGFNL
ncbi:MAG: site-2 protease family protein [Patescibacteria group bacterium]|nr:site-2 protease family protein [Patescibacteria group bacterium]